MPNLTKKPLADKHSAAGRRLIKSVKQAVAWANGEDVPVRVTMVSVERASAVDVRSVRRKLGLSQTQFAARFGFTPATVKNWEQGRTRSEEHTSELQSLRQLVCRLLLEKTKTHD